MYFGVFEFLGTSELLVILVVALVLFGPRKLPQLSRSLGKSLAEFKRASQDFKQTWEREVAMEDATHRARVDNAMLPPQDDSQARTIARDTNATAAEPKVVPAEGRMTEAGAAISHAAEPERAPETRKQDWL